MILKKINKSMSSVVETVVNEKDFYQLREEWNNLSDLTDPPSVFLRHEWFDAAWQWLKHENKELKLLCIRKGDSLIGIFPLVASTTRQYGIRRRQYELLNIPDTQQSDLLVNPGDMEECLLCLCSHLKADRTWDKIEFNKLLPQSVAVQRFFDLSQAHMIFPALNDADVNPGINLKGDWKSFYGRRSRRLKKGNNYVANLLKRSGKQFDVVSLNDITSSQYDIDELIEILITISSKSWKNKTGLTLDNRGPQDFIRRLTRHAVENGWLSVWLMCLDNKPVAVEYQIKYNGTISALRADYDQSYEDYSPGTYLNWQILEQLFASDADYYCMGPGSNEYKFRWAEELPMLKKLTMYNTTLAGISAGMIEAKIKPFIKKMLKIDS